MKPRKVCLFIFLSTLVDTNLMRYMYLGHLLKHVWLFKSYNLTFCK